MELRYLALFDRPEALRAQAELAREDFEFLHGYQSGMSWPQFLLRTDEIRRGHRLPDGYVPATFLVAQDGENLVGRVSIRHTLNPFLESVGGHIGYAVRPDFRRRGFATEILKLSLVRAKELGIERVLLTCDADNEGSRATIEACGGVPALPSGTLSQSEGKLRYWIGV